MTPSFHKFMLAAFILCAAASSFGQVYSSYIYAGGVYSKTLFSFGSAPFQFGLEQYGYSTEASGYTIMASPTRQAQPGDTSQWFTRVILGPVSFSTSLRPVAVIVIGSSIILAIGFFIASLGLRFYKRRRYETRVA